MIIYFMGNGTVYLFTHFKHDQVQQFGKLLPRKKRGNILANGGMSRN